MSFYTCRSLFTCRSLTRVGAPVGPPPSSGASADLPSAVPGGTRRTGSGGGQGGGGGALGGAGAAAADGALWTGVGATASWPFGVAYLCAGSLAPPRRRPGAQNIRKTDGHIYMYSYV